MGVPYRTQSTIIVSRSNSDSVLAFMIIKMHVLFTNRGSAASDNLLVHVHRVVCFTEFKEQPCCKAMFEEHCRRRHQYGYYHVGTVQT